MTEFLRFSAKRCSFSSSDAGARTRISPNEYGLFIALSRRITKPKARFQFPPPPPSFVGVFEDWLIFHTGFHQGSHAGRSAKEQRAEPGDHREEAGEGRRKIRSSLFSVVFKPAGFIGFHTVTDNSGSAGVTNHRDGVEAGAVAGS